MRIAFVTDTYVPQVNGVTTVLRRMVQALGNARHDVAVVAPEYPSPQLGPRADELRIPSVAFPPYPAIRLSMPAHRRVAQFLDGFAPDLVHVVTEGPLGLVGRAYALRHGKPLVTSYHTHFPRYCREYGFAALEPAVWKWMSWFHGPAVLCQTPGGDAREALAAHDIRAVVWGRGVDTRHFHPEKRDPLLRLRLGVSERETLVLHVGRLAKEKNLEVLIDAFATARDALGTRARFVIAGEGPMGERISARIPWVTRLGFVDRDRLAALYASADVCVLPSHTETCGLVALEAMASGVPVIAAAAAGLSESVVHRMNGLLITPHDALAFAAGISSMSHDREWRQRLAGQARLTALTRDSAAEDEELFAQYGQVLGQDPGRYSWRAAS